MKKTVLTAALLLLAACGQSNVERETAPASATAPAAASAPAAGSAAAAAPQWRIVGEVNSRFRYLYVLVPAGSGDAELVTLAQDIPRSEPDAWLWLVDSDEKVADGVKAGQTGDMSAFPKEWMERHIVANSVLVLHPDGRHVWTLYGGSGREREIATLPCIDGKGSCRD